jgi:hypothetical protein
MKIATTLGTIIVFFTLTESAMSRCSFSGSSAPFFWKISSNPSFEHSYRVTKDHKVCNLNPWDSLGKVKEVKIVKRPQYGKIYFDYKLNGAKYYIPTKIPLEDYTVVKFCGEIYDESGCVTVTYRFKFEL